MGHCCFCCYGQQYFGHILVTVINEFVTSFILTKFTSVLQFLF